MKRTLGSVLVLALAACGSVPGEHFYTLTAEAQGARAAEGTSRDISISVGPLTLAEIVDRPQLVVQVAAHRVAILEQQRWAEPLDHEILRVIALNLARQLGTAKVSVDPQSTGADKAIRVALDVQRFDAIAGKEVNIEVVWTVSRATGGEPVGWRSLVTEPVASPGYDAIVAAQSRALARVSRDIAAAITKAAASAAQ
jgi:uncharacterized protein